MFMDYKDIISVNTIKEFKGADKINYVPKFIYDIYSEKEPNHAGETDENAMKEINSKLAKYNLSKRKHYRD